MEMMWSNINYIIYQIKIYNITCCVRGLLPLFYYAKKIEVSVIGRE
jgi:hypothetical protein